MKKSMKKLFVLSLSVVMAISAASTSFAVSGNEPDNYLESLKEEIDRKHELIEVTYPAELEELENVTIPTLEKEIEEAKEAYEKDLEENPHNINPLLKIEMENKESQLEERKRDIDRIKEKIEREIYSVSELEKILEQRSNMAYGNYWTGEVPKDSSGNNVTHKFLIENQSGDYILTAKYRSWSPLMGGSWEYDNAITEGLKISFYEDGDCLDSSLSRAENYDTETRYAWKLPDDLNSSSSYAIEIAGKRYIVNMLNGGSDISEDYDSNDYEPDDYNSANDSYVDTTEKTTNSTATTDYPGFYDVTLTDSIPNQAYYAQATDGGWVVSLGANFEGYSEYDKLKQRGSSDLVKGWLFKDGKWYAFDSLGHQVTGWVSVGGYWYCVYPGTTALESCMLTGWQEINDGWYYFNNSGQMVANCVVDDYSIGADGLWIQ